MVTLPETIAPSGGALILISGLQATSGLAGVAVAVIGTAGVSSSGSGARSSGPMASGTARVTVGAIGKVGVGGPPSGVGDESGVTNMFGVGVGGFSKSGDRVGATLRLT